MRKLFLSIIAILTLNVGMWAQNNPWIEIGTGTQQSFNAPYNNYYNHSLNQTIYFTNRDR